MIYLSILFSLRKLLIFLSKVKHMKNLFLGLIVATSILMSACSDEDGPNTIGKIPDNVIEAFNSQYPNASNVSWSIKDDYAVASFNIAETRSDDGRNKAWYRISDAKWAMSNYEITYSNVPQIVRTAFESTEYAQSPWRYDNEVDVIVRNQYDERLYVIDAEKEENGNETEVELYYTNDGILVNTIIDAERDNDYSDWLPQNQPTDILDWINQNFPNSRIIEFDVEDGGVEVDIIFEGFKHEIVFSHSHEWIYTKTEYSRRNLSMIESVVLDALRNSTHYTNDNDIDDIDRYETAASGTFYKFDLETRYDDDIEIYISITGEVLDGRPSFGNGGSAVNDAIETFISQKYPGAIILEKDNDDGYIEVEIRHENIEKEVVFNGRNEWIHTKWEINRNQLPQDVINAITSGGYATNQIDDDIEVIETASELKYVVEIESHGDDIKLIIVNGTITNTIRD